MYISHIGPQTLVAAMPQNIENDTHVLTINKDMSTPDEDILKFLAWHGFNMKRAHVICIIFGIMNMRYLQEYIDEFMHDKENLMPRDLVMRQHEGMLSTEEIEKMLVIVTTPLPPLQMSQRSVLAAHFPR